jgi:hypothetical protein
MIECKWDADFVAGRTELGAFVQRLEESFFVKFRFRFDHLAVNRAKHAVLAESERVKDRFLDRVIGITACAVDVGNGVACDAGYPRVGGRMVLEIEIGIVERAAEKRHGIMASRAPARRFDGAVTFQRDFACFADAEQIGLVIEGLK